MSEYPHRPLREGDIIVRTRYRPARFRVVGRTAGGKLRLWNVETGAEHTAWWATTRDLPEHYRVGGPTRRPCVRCRGTGITPYQRGLPACPHCNGTGEQPR